VSRGKPHILTSASVAVSRPKATYLKI